MELHTACLISGLFNSVGFAILLTFQDSERDLVPGHCGSCFQVSYLDQIL